MRQMSGLMRPARVLIDGVPLGERYAALGLDTESLSVTTAPSLAAATAPIAILLGVETADSLTTRWLLRSERTRSFSLLPSVGTSMIHAYTTELNAELRMPDGAQASVRTGTVTFSEGRATPDETVLSVRDSGVDEILEAAVAWLTVAGACGG